MGRRFADVRRFAFEKFHWWLMAPSSSVSGRLRFAGQVKYRSYLTETECSQRKSGFGSNRRFRRTQRLSSRAKRGTEELLFAATCLLQLRRQSFSQNAGSDSPADYRPRTVTSSRTEAADLSSAAFSSAVSLISMICSIPRAPSFTGTPTNRPVMPYSPSR